MSDFPVLSRERGPQGLLARVRVPADSPYFAGHFPGAPVLPAVAQLALVEQLLEEEAPGAPWGGLERVRFRERVHPGDELELRLARSGAAWSFTIARDGRLVAQGRSLAPV